MKTEPYIEKTERRHKDMPKNRKIIIIYLLEIVIAAVFYLAVIFSGNPWGGSMDFLLGISLLILGISGILFEHFDSGHNDEFCILGYVLLVRLMCNLIFSHGLDVYHVRDAAADVVSGLAAISIFFVTSIPFFRQPDGFFHGIPINYLICGMFLSEYWCEFLPSAVIPMANTIMMIVFILYGRSRKRNTVWLSIVGIFSSLSILSSFGTDPVPFLLSIVISVLGIAGVIAASRKRIQGKEKF